MSVIIFLNFPSSSVFYKKESVRLGIGHKDIDWSLEITYNANYFLFLSVSKQALSLFDPRSIYDKQLKVDGTHGVTLIFQSSNHQEANAKMLLRVVTSVLKQDGSVCAQWEPVAKIRGVAVCLFSNC